MLVQATEGEAKAVAAAVGAGVDYTTEITRQGEHEQYIQCIPNVSTKRPTASY